MFKRSTRVTALLLAFFMLAALCPFAPSLPAASAAFSDFTEPGRELDYDALRGRAYIIDPAWSGLLSSGRELTYSFRGASYVETYDPARHFATFADAYAAFEAAHTKSGVLQRSFATETPVFLLAPGTYSDPRMTVRGSAIILGSNAGVSPNAELDFEHADPRAGWDAAGRHPETVVNGGFSLNTRVGGSAAANKYENVLKAANVARRELIVDGISFSAGASLVTVGEVNGGAKRENAVVVQNSLVTVSNTSLVINDDECFDGVNVYEYKNVRSVGSLTNGFYGVKTSRVTAAGLYLAEGNGSFASNNLIPTSSELAICVRDSYFYKINYWTPLAFRNSNVDNVSILIDGNILYESASGNYGAMVFYTKPSSSNEIRFTNNTVLFDKSFNVNCQANTLFNGSTSYQLGPYYLYVRYNRIIGFQSMFPNLTNNSTLVTGDMNFNYFAPEYNGYGDVLGTRSGYSNGAGFPKGSGYHNTQNEETPYSDPFVINDIVYYEDYAKTLFEGSMDVSGVSFYDQADTVSIDNEHDVVSATFSSAVTVTNPALIFKHEGSSAEFYADEACTERLYEFITPSRDRSDVIYAMRRHGSTSKLLTIELYGVDAVPAFASSYTDEYGVISRSAYLYDPSVSAVATGTAVTAVWRGREYTFTVGVNAFARTAQIFSAAGRGGNPQIIVPHGSYGALSVSQPCEIYGEEYYAPAAAGLGADGWYTGPGVDGSSSTLFTSVVIGSAGVKLSGVEITGTITDASRSSAGSVTLENSVINVSAGSSSGFREINVTNKSVGTAANEYVLRGVWVKNIRTDSATGLRVLFGGSLPSSVTVSGCLFDGVTRLFGGTWNSALYTSPCSVTVTGCRFNGVSASDSLICDLRDGIGSAGMSLGFSITDNAFFADESGEGAVISLTPDAYSALDLSRNWFINSKNSGSMLACSYKNTVYSGAGVTAADNRAIGFNGDIGASGYAGKGAVIDLSYNYFAPYEEGFRSARSGACPTGYAVCTGYYKDYALTEAFSPIEVTFADRDDMTVKNGVISIFAASAINVFDYISVPDGSTVQTTYYAGGEADPGAIGLTGAVTVLTLRVGVEGNVMNYAQYELRISKHIDDELIPEYVTSDKGVITFNADLGTYTLELPDTSSGAAITVTVQSGSGWQLLKDGTPVDSVENVESGSSVPYVIRVIAGERSADYPLNVIRRASSGNDLDYDALVNTAYVIRSGWAGTAAGTTVRFYYRGKSVAQPFDPDRHFDSYAAAYAHWLSTGPDILHDTPVFILTPGTYGSLTVNYRAVILGANAGFDPNDPTVDVSTFTPNDDLAENPAWNSDYETVINGTVYRTSRINANADLTHEYAIQQAEAASDERLTFSFTLDGVKFSGGDGVIRASDIDTGNRSSTATGNLTVIGSRRAEYFVQNAKLEDTTNVFFNAWDSSRNLNSVTVKNLRVTGMNTTAMFNKYVDDLTVDGCYFTGNTLSVSLIGREGDMQLENDPHYVFKNNVFRNNKLTRVVRMNTTPRPGSTYSSGLLEAYNNAIIESVNAAWGAFSLSSAGLPDMTFDLHDNLIFQDGSYTGVKMHTAVEGNSAFFVNPMTLRFYRNRVIGADSYLPNMQNLSDDNLAKLDFDFNGNYFAPAFTSTSDKAGVRASYYSLVGTNDPINPASLEYYLDWDLKVLNTDMDVTGVSFGGTELVFTANHAERKLSVTLTEDKTAPLTFDTVGDGVAQTLLDGSGEPVSPLRYTDVMAGESDFTLRLEKNGIVVTYAVTLSAGVAKDFKTEFSDPAGEIKNTAFVLSTVTADMSTGDTIEIMWRGRLYRFTVGVNAFPNTSEAQSVYGTAEKQILIPAGDYEDDLYLYGNSSVFGVNYDVDPNVKGADPADDWTENPAWGVYGESGVGPIVIAGEARKTTVSIKGVTMRDRFNDTERPDEFSTTRIVIENCVVDHRDWLPANGYGSTWYMFNFNCPATYGGTNASYKAKDVAILRNIRVKNLRCYSEVSAGRNRLLNEYLPYDFTMEGMYVDSTASQCSYFGWWKLSQKRASGTLNVINCNFRNLNYGSGGRIVQFEARDHGNNEEGQKLTLNIIGNTFYNAMKTQTIAISPYGYTDINITGNTVVSSANSTNSFIQWQDTSVPNGVNISFYRNRIVGTNGKLATPAGMETALDISGNYWNTYSADFRTATDGKPLTEGSNGWYYTDYAMTATNGGLNYVLDDAVIPNASARTLTLTVGRGIDSFDFADYVVSDGGCTFTLEECPVAAIPATESGEYTLTIENGGLSEQWTLVINVTAADLTALYEALGHAEAADLTAYRDFAAARITAAADAGRAYLHDPHVTDAQASAAAARIERALAIAERINDLDALIETARGLDVSSAGEAEKTALAAAINSADGVASGGDSSLEDLNEAYDDLSKTISGIRVGLAQFRIDIDTAAEIINSRYAKYNTPDSLAALTAAYEAAVEAYEGYGSTVDDDGVIAAHEALNAALAALTPDTSALTEKLADMNAVNNDDEAYCTGGYAQFVAEREAIAAATPSTAEEVGQLAERADDAYELLTTHNYGEFTYNNDAGCETDGTETAACINAGCEHTLTRVRPGSANGHEWDDGVVQTAPTCTEEGVMLYTCTKDSTHTRTEPIATDPDAHDFVMKFDSGSHWLECSLCGLKKDAAPHEFDGLSDPDCNVCDYVKEGDLAGINPMTVGGVTYTGDDMTVAAGDDGVYDLAGNTVNGYNNVLELFSDPELEMKVADLHAVYVAPTGSDYYLRVTSPDGESKSELIKLTLTRETRTALDIAAEDAGSGKLRWVAEFADSGDAFADVDGTRLLSVGALYLTSIDARFVNVDEIETQIIASAETIDKDASAINRRLASAGSPAKIHPLSVTPASAWNDARQAFCFSYEAVAGAGSTRYAVMYAVRRTADGTVIVDFTDILAQTAK